MCIRDRCKCVLRIGKCIFCGPVLAILLHDDVHVQAGDLVLLAVNDTGDGGSLIAMQHDDVAGDILVDQNLDVYKRQPNGSSAARKPPEPLTVT